MYIYNLPYAERKELCRILDRDRKWEELGGKYMMYDMMTIWDLQRDDLRGISPTDQLLAMWGQQNHTVLQLFILLSKMHHYQAMSILRPFVDSKYHPLIDEGEENLSKLFCKGNANKSPNYRDPPDNKQNSSGAEANGIVAPPGYLDKNMNVGSHNFNKPETTSNTPQNKMLPLLQEPMENKILNMPSNSDNRSMNSKSTLPFGAAHVPVSPVAPLPLPQPPVQDVVRVLKTENKENMSPIPKQPAVHVNERYLYHHHEELQQPEQQPLQQQPQPPQQHRKISTCSNASSLSESCIAIPRIPYTELEVATNGWDKITIIGKGGFGTVFKGNWKNTLVAIKRIEQRGAESAESHRAQMEQSVRELHILNACRHDNILPLYGYSMDGAEPCLVYQFMPNGSLEDRLLCRQGTKPLTWMQRHNIAQGTARGLQFLHGKPLIHGDIKSANILLDNNFEPRIGDFGLARDGPQGQDTHMKVSRVHGTRPYLPDEFLRGKQMSTKVDTYSFGIVLFELATGLRAYDDSRANKFLKDHVESCEEEQLLTLYDQKVGHCDSHIYLCLIQLGKRCVTRLARSRPEMEEVLKQLENIGDYRRLAQKSLPQGNSLNPRPQGMSPVPNALLLPSPSPVPLWATIALSPEPSNRGIPIGVNYIHSPGPHQFSPYNSPHPVQHNNACEEVNVIPLLKIHQEETHTSEESSQEPGEGAFALVPPSGSNSDMKGVLPLISALGIKDASDNSTHSSDKSLESSVPKITALNKPFLLGGL